MSNTNRIAAVANVPADEDKEIEEAAAASPKKPDGPPPPEQPTIFEE